MGERKRPSNTDPCPAADHIPTTGAAAAEPASAGEQACREKSWKEQLYGVHIEHRNTTMPRHLQPLRKMVVHENGRLADAGRLRLTVAQVHDLIEQRLTDTHRLERLEDISGVPGDQYQALAHFHQPIDEAHGLRIGCAIAYQSIVEVQVGGVEGICKLGDADNAPLHPHQSGVGHYLQIA